MSQTWHLGGQAYTLQGDAGPRDASGRTWRFVRRESDGARFLLQTWDPRPSDKELDAIKDSFLRAVAEATSLDALEVHFGFDEATLWLLQGLQGTPLSRLWPEWPSETRAIFLHHLQKTLDQNRAPRLLHPEAIGLKPGRVFVPWVIGPDPWSPDRLPALLPETPPDSHARAVRLWEQAPELSDPVARPIRGRLQERTYLKSLMLGLNAPVPMERIVLIHGEEGLGVERMAAWAVAAAETDGHWVSRLEIQPEDTPATIFERLLQALILGREAELYAHSPELARTLARHLEAFAFLRAGSRTLREAPVEGDDIRAALQVIDEATTFHSRLVHVDGMERAQADVADFLKELVLKSRMPWLLTATGTGPHLKAFLGPLRADENSAYVSLNRLEDEDLSLVLGDILQDHRIPVPAQEAICRASLGNPGILESILELAQIEGKVVWSAGTWLFNAASSSELKIHEDLLSEILVGRLQRMSGPSAAVVRTLALAGRPILASTLGKALGLAGEPYDAALQPVLSSRLAHVNEGRITLADPRLKELALASAPAGDCTRMARSLLAALEEEVGQPVLSVRLQSYVSDPPTALAQVMQAIEAQAPDPREAEEVVQDALGLSPTPFQRARLLEFLADAWSRGPAPVSGVHEPGTTPAHRALEALDRALVALEEPQDPPEEGRQEALARLCVKKALLELKLDLVDPAAASATRAAELLADHPFHPGQARLRLLQGRIALSRGAQSQGIRALEEGLQLIEMLGPRGDRNDQVALLLELGRALGRRSQFQRAVALLQSAQRLIEHSQDSRRHVSVLLALAEIQTAQGQPEPAYYLMRDALRSARTQGQPLLQAKAHLAIGMLRSQECLLSPALSHLDAAMERFGTYGNAEVLNRTRLWKARTLAALGDTVQCELLVLQACAAGTRGQSFLLRGDQAFLQAEVAGFQDAWRDAGRLYQTALEAYDQGGLIFRGYLAALRRIQAEAHEVLLGGRRIPLAPLWERLEALKGPAEGSGSRWVELEWHRAHGLLLSTSEPSDPVVMEAIQTWGIVLGAAREMRFPTVVLEAASQCAVLLLERGERLGAGTRIQDAYPSYQEIWNHVPDTYETAFLGRAEMHRFRLAVEGCGLKFITPEKVDPLADWTPTLSTASILKFPGTDR